MLPLPQSSPNSGQSAAVSMFGAFPANPFEYSSVLSSPFADCHPHHLPSSLGALSSTNWLPARSSSSQAPLFLSPLSVGNSPPSGAPNLRSPGDSTIHSPSSIDSGSAPLPQAPTPTTPFVSSYEAWNTTRQAAAFISNYMHTLVQHQQLATKNNATNLTPEQLHQEWQVCLKEAQALAVSSGGARPPRDLDSQ